jgi:hypothetical protein
MTVEKATEPTVTQRDLDWVNERIRKTNTKIRLLVRILVDKKIIGQEMAKTFEETVDEDKANEEKTRKWFEKKHLKMTEEKNKNEGD